MSPSTLQAKLTAQPTSGALAWPSTSEIVQLCSGQATLSPSTMPWLSGPPLCGQRSSNANTRWSALRNTATASPCSRPTRRAPSGGISSTRHTACQIVDRAFIEPPWPCGPSPVEAANAFGAAVQRSCGDGSGHRRELPQVDARLRVLEPRVGLAVERELQPCPQRLAIRRVLEHLLLHVLDADAADVMHRALEVPAFLAVQLQEG